MRYLSISVDAKLYHRLQHIMDTYGFTDFCEFNTALLTTLVGYIEEAEKRKSMGGRHPDADEITNMFNEFGNWEHTPDGVVPVRHKNRIL